MEAKIELAKKAVSLIPNNSVLGLGASSTMKYIVKDVSAAIQQGLQVALLTSSFATQQLLLEHDLHVYAISGYDAVDIYFDGCDQFDRQLNAVKSGGGIHTNEKILASMAKQFILLGDHTKYVDQFDPKFPLVLEVLPASHRYVQAEIKKLFPGSSTTTRISDKKIGAAITDHGNYLVDVWFTKWPEAAIVHEMVSKITGVLEHSLFYQLAHLALVPGEHEINIIQSKKR